MEGLRKVGGGKSYLISFWLVTSCLKYPGSRYLLGRSILKRIKESTLLTIFEVLKTLELRSGIEYNYNSVEGKITFYNESEIYLKDLFAYPSDPEFDSLGSTEFTGAAIDEASEITEKAFNIVMSRIRYKLDQFGICPKLIIATNPCKNFIYFNFYKLAINNTLPVYRVFVPALVQDNPFISSHYVENLKKLDQNSKERLLFGNWEYDDDPTKLFEYDDIMNIFSSDYKIEPFEKYLSVDVARFGNDKTVLIIWQGWYIKKIMFLEKSSTVTSEEAIKKICREENIKRSNVVIDEDGVGGGVVDHLEGVKGFVNNSSPVDLEDKALNYANLKTQCYFHLAKIVKQGSIGCYKDVNVDVKKMIIQELEVIKVKTPDKENKLSIIKKDEIKDLIGRSCDFADALMMRAYFDVCERKVSWFFG